MKQIPALFAAALFGLLAFPPGRAADLNGQWRGEVATPMGQLKLILTLQVEGNKVSGKTAVDFDGEKHESTLQDVKLVGDKLTFFENVDMQGNTMRIDSTGTVGADEISFTRKIGDFGDDSFVAHRIKPVVSPAAAVSGQWSGNIETPMGQLKMNLTLKVEGDKVSGKSVADVGGQKYESILQDVKVAGNTLTYFENIDMQGNPLRIDYTGTVGADEISFTRKLGDFGDDSFIAHRVKPAPAPATEPAPAERARANMNRPVVLGPDDKRAVPDAPAGFDVKRDAIPHGKAELVEYDSKSVGARRKMTVYTPPGYSSDHKYPVLYLLHGIGGDETEWMRWCAPDVILDNLLADGKILPMIVVFPNGRALKNDSAEGNIFTPEKVAGFAAFERDLIEDLIPAIQARYSVQADREHRALAGYSMGGGQSLNFGLGHLETFAWLGAFSSAPNTKTPSELVPDPVAARAKLKFFWLSCGNKDGLMNISQGVHAYLKQNNVPHTWNVDDNGHDSTSWRNNLYHFTQHLFR